MQKLWTKNYIMIMVVNFVTAMVHSAFVATMPMFVGQLGGNNALAGAMTMGQTLVTILCRPVCGYLSDRYGRKETLLLGGGIFALNTLVYSFATSLNLLFVVRVLHGIGIGMFTVSAATLVADIVPEDRLVDGISFYSISSSLSTAVAPMLGSYLSSSFGFPVLFVAMSVSAVSGVIFSCVIHLQAQLHVPVSQPSADTPAPAKPVVRLIEVSVLAPSLVALFISLGVSAGSNFIPIFGLEKGIASISVYFFFNGVFMIISRLIAGKLSAKVGYTKSILLGIALVGVSYLLLSTANSLAPVIAAGMLCGLGNGIATPIINSFAYTMCEPDRKGSAQATYGIFTFCGTGFGAVLWGSVSEIFSLSFVFILAAGTMLCAMATYGLLLRPRIQTSLTLEQKDAKTHGV